MKSWIPTKQSKMMYAHKMNQIQHFCMDKEIIVSQNSCSYFFKLNGKNYIVYNRSKNSKEKILEEIRNIHNLNIDESNINYIFSSKLKIIDVYNSLLTNEKI